MDTPNENMTEKVLFVDDDPNILKSIARQFEDVIDLELVNCPNRALELLAGSGVYPVVVSDMQMPGMSGIDFLARVKELRPETVRIMMTGHADLNSAIQAVNCGNIFRYLTKPCSTEELARAIRDGVVQYQFITSGRDTRNVRDIDQTLTVINEVLDSVDEMIVQSFRVATMARLVVEPDEPTVATAPGSENNDLLTALSDLAARGAEPSEYREAILQYQQSSTPLSPRQQRLMNELNSQLDVFDRLATWRKVINH